MASEENIREWLRELGEFGLLRPRLGAPEGLDLRDPERRLKTITSLMIRWHRVFIDVSPEDFRYAVEAFFRSEKSQFYPQPGTLRTFLPSRHHRDLVAESADAAWSELWQGVSRFGCEPERPRTPYLWETFKDPLYGPQWYWSGEEAEREAKRYALRSMGGFSNVLRQRRDDNEQSLLNRWRQAFRTYVREHGIREELAIVRKLATEKYEFDAHRLGGQPAQAQHQPAQIQQDLELETASARRRHGLKVVRREDER